MAGTVAATKGNLLAMKKSLALARNGYDLMDRKRNILIKEMMELVDKVKMLRGEIQEAYDTGYYLLQRANIYSGVIDRIADEVPVETDIKLTYRSVMGVEVPEVIYEPKKDAPIPYGLDETNSHIDEAYLQFQKVKEITMILAEVDKYPLGGLPEALQPLYNIALSLAEVAPHLELYGGAVGVPYAFEETRFVAVHGAQPTWQGLQPMAHP